MVYFARFFVMLLGVGRHSLPKKRRHSSVYALTALAPAAVLLMSQSDTTPAAEVAEACLLYTSDAADDVAGV